MPASGEQRIADLGTDRPLPQWCRQRAAGAPKADTQRPDRFGFGTGDRPLGSRRGFPGSARFLDGGENRDDMREPADRKNLAHNRMETGDGRPALEMYSTPEKSTMTSAELTPTAASSRA